VYSLHVLLYIVLVGCLLLLGHRNASNRNSAELKKDCDTIHNFISQQQGQSVLVYTDGSVFNGPAGCGACAAVLNPLSAVSAQVKL